MKKSKLVLVACICLLMSIVFCACGNKASEAFSPVGTWTLTSIKDADGNQFTLEEYCEAQDIDSAGMEATYTFNDDETVIGDIAGISTEGTYKVSGNSVTVTFSGTDATMEYNAEADTLVASDSTSGMSSIFTRS